MAIAVDATSTGAKATGATSISWSHTVGNALSNSMLIVGGSTGNSTVTFISSVVWDSAGAATAMCNQLKGVILAQTEGNNHVNANIFFLRSPTSGTKTILLSAPVACELTGGSSSYSGVDQTNGFCRGTPTLATFSTTPTDNPTVDITTVSGDMVVDCVCMNQSGTAQSLTVGAGQTEIFNQNNGDTTSIGAGSYEAAVGGTTTMSWNKNGASSACAQVAFAMIPFAAAAVNSASIFYIKS